MPKEKPLKSHGSFNITDEMSWKGMFKSTKKKKTNPTISFVSAK